MAIGKRSAHHISGPAQDGAQRSALGGTCRRGERWPLEGPTEVGEVAVPATLAGGAQEIALATLAPWRFKVRNGYGDCIPAEVWREGACGRGASLHRGLGVVTAGGWTPARGLMRCRTPGREAPPAGRSRPWVAQYPRPRWLTIGWPLTESSASPCRIKNLTSQRCPVPSASRGCTEDEGRPFGAALQGEASNRHERLGSNAPVVSVMEKAGPPVRWGLER